MTRHLKPLNLLAVVTLMSGCGEGLTPETDVKLGKAPEGGLATVTQEISSFGYSTYLGFGGDEYGTASAIDGAGNTYLTGTTTTFGGTNIFIAKMSPTGTNLYYTYFAGTEARGIAVDSAGNAYVVGMTAAGPTITKVNPAGTSILYMASLGWSSIASVKVDSAGNAYVVGSVSNGFNGQDVAVAKVDPTGTYLVYNQVFGGSGDDKGNGIAIDTSGNAYIVGDTASANFPLGTSPFQATLRGARDAFITKMNAAGTSLLFSTYLGGNGNDYGNGIALDASNNVYVTGSTESQSGAWSFPVTSGTVQVTSGGGISDAYVARFNSLGSRIYATYLGGGGAESGKAIAVTSTGSAHVTGTTSSANFITTSLAKQTFAQGGEDAFVVQLNTAFSSRTYSTYLGGSGTDRGSSISVDSSGNAYVVGSTNSANFPTTVYAAGGLFDAFVTKFNGP